MAESPLSPVQKAALALQRARAKLDALKQARGEPIAVIGMGARFAGGVETPADLWRLLLDGRDGIRKVPEDRWDADALYDPDPQAPGKIRTRHGGFLDRVDGFEPSFFGIAPIEARSLDPQQRLLLEVAWEALESAGQRARDLSGSATGVFVGICGSDYLQTLIAGGDLARVDDYAGTGNTSSVAAGRLAYVWGLQGPAIAVDTACSSSLVAVHLAVQSLRADECELALAGGVTLHLAPHSSVYFSRIGALAADGRCKAFDAAADGYGRGEGCGLLVLKRLSRALRDRDPIRALIRGSAVNQDGRSGGLTAPNGAAQERVIAAALANAGVEPSSVGYVEAHGTGTPLGDPIELRALGRAYCRQRRAPLRVGSVKANLGHTEGAAGVAGLIKAALVVEHGLIPPQIHLHQPNPEAPWAEFPLEVPVRVEALPPADTPPRAGVSAFGYSGTNVHVIVEAPPAVTPPAPSEPARRSFFLPLSAASEPALAELAAAYARRLRARPEGEPLEDLCFSAGARRDHHRQRLAVVGDGAGELAELLDGFDGAADAPGRLQAQAPPGRVPRVALVFPGMSMRPPLAALELRRREPAFGEAWTRCEAQIRDCAGWSLSDEVERGDRIRAGDVAVIQPTGFALQVSLAALWAAWGLRPSAVIGHSMGEVAAAHVAGALDLEQAVLVICRRSQLLAEATGLGAMAVVGLSRERLAERLAGRDGQVFVAAHNSHDALVLAGAPAAVEGLVRELEADNVFCRRLAYDLPSHCPLVAPHAERLAAALGTLRPAAPGAPMYSTVSGARLEGAVLDADYWRRNMLQPVRFAEAVGALLRDGVEAFVELSDHPGLLTALEAEAGRAGSTPACLPSLDPDEWPERTLLISLAALHCAGLEVDWRGLYPGGRRFVALPGTPWQRRRYWLEDASSRPAPPRASSSEPDVSELFYALDWPARPLPPRSVSAGAPGAYLLAGGDEPLASALATALRAGGHAVTRLAEGAPAREVVAAWRVPGRELSLVDLRGTASVDPGDDPARAIGSRCLEVARLAQAVAGAPPAARLWLVTRGAQVLPGAPAARGALINAPLWGLGRVVALEQPELWGGLIDLDPAPGVSVDEQVAALLAEFEADDAEDQVAYRGGRHVARLARAPLRAGAGDEPPVRGDGTYLITGGLGLVGTEIARWLAGRGAGRLVLVSRSAGGRSSPALEALRAAGSEVELVGADVADFDRLAELVAAIQTSSRPLRGVVHAAGVSRRARVAELDAPALDEALRAKVSGAWHLHRLTAGLDLDLFVLCSSAAATWGSQGMGHYAAANQFLDALAALRRAEGRPATSIGWGFWRGGGMVSEEAARYFGAIGLETMPPEECLVALRAALAQGVSHRVVARVDWDVFSPTYQARRERKLLERLGSEGGGAAPARVPRPTPTVQELAALDAAGRGERLRALLRTEVGAVLGLDAGELDPRQIPADQGFFQLGLDSIMVIRLRARLQQLFGLSLPRTLVLEHPSIAALSEALAGYLPAPSAPDAAEVASPARAAPASLPSAGVAIVGIGCRLPGGVDDLEGFWELLREGRCAVAEVPESRWRGGGRLGLLGDVEAFDAALFGISPREAACLDPQHRLLLEVAWQALEHAGIAPDSLHGTRAGVFVGITGNDYARLLDGLGEDAIDAHYLVGNSSNFAAGRLSHVLGVEGPSLAVDTACSSSLVAAHLAARSLQSGEIDLALVAGVNLILAPAGVRAAERAGMLSPRGLCRSFDASADGIVRGEGCAVVVLERAADTAARGARALALWRGSAVNHDGRSAGLTVPNRQAQERVIRAALAAAGVEAHAIGYVETHGTGTPLGDPIEARALAAVLADGRPAGRPLALGAVKTNLGHLESAAGVVGLIKAVLVLREREFPRILHLERPTPAVEWERLPLRLPTARTAWPRDGGPALAGVSSFGGSGTNAHVILSEPAESEPAAAPAASAADAAERDAHLLVLSAHDEPALRALARRYAARLAGASVAELADVCHAAATTRARLGQRLAVVGASAEQVRLALTRHADGATQADVVCGRCPAEAPRVTFVLPLPPALAPGSAATLARGVPAFRRALEVCDALIRGPLGESVAALLLAPRDDAGAAARLARPLHGVPAAFALAHALACTWRHWGLVPRRAEGEGAMSHAAAWIEGRIDLADAVRRTLDDARRLDAGRDPEPTPASTPATDELRLELGPPRPDAERGTLTSLGVAGDDWPPVLRSLGELYLRGVALDWRRFDEGHARRRVGLPFYPFQRKRYWLPESPAARPTARRAVPPPVAVYALDWVPAPRQHAAEAGAPGTWLVLSDRGGVGPALAALLRAEGHACRLVEPPALERPADALASDLAAVLAETRGLRGVVSLWALEPWSSRAPERVLEGALGLLRALSGEPDLWLVTRGAQPAGAGERLDVDQAALWGLGRVAALELPLLWRGLIDLDPRAAPASQAASLRDEILRGDGEDQIAIRATQRLAARLRARAGGVGRAPLALSPEATFLITGGLGGVGLEFARFLVERGARWLVLSSRTEAPAARPEVRQALQALRARGATVEVLPCDVADAAAMGALLAHIDARLPRLGGVVHAAGVNQPALLRELDAARLHAVLRPKIEGARVLDRLTREMPLELFVLCSSAAAVWGSIGMGSYAAANQFLDALAHERRARGLPAVSVAWGPWAGTGMSSGESEAWLARMGVAAAPPAELLRAFEGVLADGLAQATVAAVDWPTFRRVYDARGPRRLLRDLAEPALAPPRAPVSGAHGARPEILAELRAAGDPARLLERYLAARVAAALGLEAGACGADDDVFALGMDSVMLIEVLQECELDLRLKLYPKDFFSHPTVARFARLLLAELALDAAPARAVGAEALAPRAAAGHGEPPAPVFLLSSPRSGSTLLRVMLAGHPDLFCPPELHLLQFDDLAQRGRALDAAALGEGLTRAVMELRDLDAGGAAAWLDELTRAGASIREVYESLRAWAAPRRLVDKSPGYAARRATLERARELFPGARYVHLVRHPYAVIESVLRTRMDRLMGFGGDDRMAGAEFVWAESNANILDFCARLDPALCHRVRFEELVAEPEAVMRALSAALGLPFDPRLLAPYEGRRMTDGVHPWSLPLGDPNFRAHGRIDSEAGEVWRQVVLERPLGGYARRIAAELGYELPAERSAAPSVQASGAFSGRLLERSLESRAVGKTVHYSALLPAAGAAGGRPLPLILALTGVEAGLVTRFQRIPDQLMAKGRLRPAVVVVPDCERSLYMNRFDGRADWETYLLDELIPRLGDDLGVALDLRRIALIGVSMGGLGSLRLAFRRPETFTAVSAHGPAIEAALTFSEVDPHTPLARLRPPEFLAELFGQPVDADGHWTRNNPAYLARENAARIRAARLGIEIHCGAEDELARDGVAFLRRTLDGAGIAHGVHLVEGAGHDRAFFTESLTRGFLYLSDQLGEREAP